MSVPLRPDVAPRTAYAGRGNAASGPDREAISLWVKHGDEAPTPFIEALAELHVASLQAAQDAATAAHKLEELLAQTWDVCCLQCGWLYTEDLGQDFVAEDVIATQADAAWQAAMHECPVMVQIRPPGETRWSRPFTEPNLSRLEEPF